MPASRAKKVKAVEVVDLVSSSSKASQSSGSTRSTRASRGSALRQSIRNSSDVSDDDHLEIPSGHKVAVVIPTSNPSRAASTVSGESNVFDTDGAAGTPDTSNAGTPFSIDKRKGSTPATLSNRLKKLAAPVSERSTRKSSRTVQEQLSADEAYARGLQDELYNQSADEDPASYGAGHKKSKKDTRAIFGEDTKGSRLPSRTSRGIFPETYDDDDEAEAIETSKAIPMRPTKKKIPVPLSDDDEPIRRSRIPTKSAKKKTPTSRGRSMLEIPALDTDTEYADEHATADSADASEDDVFNPGDSEEDFVPLSRIPSKKRKTKAPVVKARKRAKVLDSHKSKAKTGNKEIDADLNAESSLDTPLSSVLPSDISDVDMDTSGPRDMSHFEKKYPRTKHGIKPRSMLRSDWERKKLDTSHPQLKTLWDDLDQDVPVIKPTPDPQPTDINRQLKGFQLEGLNWMRRMESEGKWKGGLLGDEMGMGKTIQAVSLIMSDYPAGKPTLVVLPPVALMQWSQEITSYTDGKLKILVHHNSDPKVKKMNVKDLLKYDVILISYAGLESAHRKEIKGWKRDDGLVKENSKIHSIQFHRLILDEAHSIKTRTTQVARACFALKSDYKWCLSGTPVQNRIGEFFSLLRFLEVSPFANYFCKSCPCSVIHWEKDEHHSCVECGHRGFDHVSLFNQELLNPMTSGDAVMRKEAMRKLRLITDRIMLRRLKKDHTASMELPPKMVVIHREFFGEKERDFSKSIMSNTARQFDTYVARGVMLNNYANIFGLIMQMRQVANHPDLILKKKAEGGQNVLVCCICDDPAEEPIRSMCHHEFCRQCAKNYVRGFVETGGNPDCPQCHIALKIDFDQPDIEQDEDAVKKSSIINRIKMENWTSSTKIEMLVYDLYKLRSKKQTIKSIVFSQFTSMLQLIDWRLRRAGFSTVMLDGTMSPQQRQNSIEYFMNNVNVEVFLVSLKAGGVALNLTEASHVFIVDPWWNPAAEWQSADRVHRIGQLRPCVITRLVIEDSVESRMVLLQEKKANLINSTVNRDDVALEKLTPEDMQFLFRGS